MLAGDTATVVNHLLELYEFDGGDSVMNADGSDVTRLTDNPADDGFSGDPAWSPNGSRIAFVSERHGNDEIYVMNADGSGLTNLTNNAALDTNPAWSPAP